MVTMMPVAVVAAKFSWVDMWLPRFMWLTPFVLYAVNYAVLINTLISRCHRDSILMELHRLTVQLNREMRRAGKQMNSKLQRLLYMKSFTLLFLCLCYILGTFKYNGGFTVPMFLTCLLINNGYNFLIATPHLYFVSFWQVARGYDFVNQQLEELISTRSPLASGYAEELRSIWSLHARLSRTAHKINTIYGRQMLAARLDYLSFAVINSYFGIIFSLGVQSNYFAKLYGALLCCTRMMDFFMADYICDLVAQYQSTAKHTVSEGIMSDEVCGLFPVNRKEWLNMMGSVLCHSVVLLQYHLMMSAKPEKQY
ncbi:putative gustatory receptor 59b isoform X3 [Drosophila obscura]|uniref:putative gustatory receptor 59b isoform X3 n=1 Tax=Drosophila obscura TaxID=7282 RepID=UPI001BB0D9F9|nr:putative gustatory receptor 59b isoform X3 [Drosophila obscura]